MNLKRGQFLILSGMVVSFGLAILVHKVIEVKASKHSSTSASDFTALNATSQSNGSGSGGDQLLALKGLFAPPRGDVRIAVISDLNSQYGSTSYEPEVTKAIALIPTWQPDIVIGGGDMVAGQSPTLSIEEIKAMWAAFDYHVGAPLRKARLPFGFTIGNHDASAAISPVSGKFLFSNERKLAAAHWNNPKYDPGLQFVDRSEFPFYYSFQRNNIFYLVWDASTAKFPPKQLAWVEKSLASPTAQSAKMRIVVGHLPLYAVAVGRDESGEILDNADKLRLLLERYRVHTYISGHHHAYFPGHRGQLQLLHTGALGSGPRPLLNSSLPTQKTLTVVDVNLGSASTTYTTYDMTTLQVVDHQKLPRIIVGPNGMVLRRDVELNELTPAERSLSYTPSN